MPPFLRSTEGLQFPEPQTETETEPQTETETETETEPTTTELRPAFSTRAA